MFSNSKKEKYILAALHDQPENIYILLDSNLNFVLKSNSYEFINNIRNYLNEENYK